MVDVSVLHIPTTALLSMTPRKQKKYIKSHNIENQLTDDKSNVLSLLCDL